MITGLQQRIIMNKFLTIAAILFCVANIDYACQNKKAIKAMNEEGINKQPADTNRLLSVANLEQTDSGRQVIAWFFETPQVFEFSLDSEKTRQFYKLLKEAKEKQLPVNVHSTVLQDKNIIDLILPATEPQINRFKNEKAQRQQPVSVPPPPHN